MEIENVVQNGDKVTILKNAVENGKATKKAANLFNALKEENADPISENDFAAFNLFKDKNGELSLTDERLKALKLFDINNDGTFQDSEFKLMELAHKLGGDSFLLKANIVDVNKNGKLDNKEIDLLAKILKEYAKPIDKKIKNQKDIFELYGQSPLYSAIPEKEAKEIFRKIGKDKELLEKVLLAKDNIGQTPLHNSNVQVTKLILDKIGKDKKLLEKVLLAENDYGDIPVRWFCFGIKTKLILDKVGDDKDLFRKILFSKDDYGNTILQSADADQTKIFLDKIGDDTDLLEEILLTKTKYGATPLLNADEYKTKVILEKIDSIKDKHIAKALLGKLLNEKNKNGKTIYDYAVDEKKDLLKSFAEKFGIKLEQ